MSGLEIIRTSPPVSTGGYTAQRGLVKGTINVFATCGCVFTAASSGETVLTLCQKNGCQFQWQFAVDAIKALEDMETNRAKVTQQPNPG